MEDELAELTGVRWTYSRVDATTGEYLRVGTIERASRFLDLPAAAPLLADEAPDAATWDALVAAARETTFAEFDPAEVLGFLQSVRKLEAVTRHKANPNCPALGDRAQLKAAGLVSDALVANAVVAD